MRSHILLTTARAIAAIGRNAPTLRIPLFATLAVLAMAAVFIASTT